MPPWCRANFQRREKTCGSTWGSLPLSTVGLEAVGGASMTLRFGSSLPQWSRRTSGQWTFLTYRRSVQGCSSCLASNHDQDDGGLNPGRQTRLADAGRHRDAGRTGKYVYKRRRRGACYAWNDGKCHATSCRFDHVCSRCHGDHKRAVCGSSELAIESGSGHVGQGGN